MPEVNLLIRCGDTAYTALPGDGEVTIGREFPAQIRIDDPRISRIHLRIDATANGWVATDTGSTNGTFVDGQRQSRIAIAGPMTIRLGNADGIAVNLSPDGDQSGQTTDTSLDVMDSGPDTTGATDEVDEDRTYYAEVIDADIARAGAAVAARREELGFPQRKLNDDKIISQSVLVAFERGRSWPRERTRAKIEEYLKWPPGTIARIRHGGAVPEEDNTEVLSNSVQVAVMIDAAELALGGIKARMEILPPTSDPAYGAAAGILLKELRKLQSTAANAARSAKGATEIALILGDVRRTYNDLMLRSARAPGATLGQRLYAARHRAELTPEETANASGVSVDDVTAAEAEVPPSPAAVAALESFISRLTHR
jgi:pSer/pThr/pTyr-binding forkhead associated (FHA) protein